MNAVDFKKLERAFCEKPAAAFSKPALAAKAAIPSCATRAGDGGSQMSRPSTSRVSFSTSECNSGCCGLIVSALR